MSAQYVLCGHMSVQYALSGEFCWFPSLVDTVAFLEFRPVGNVRKNFGGSAIMAVRLY